MDAIPSRLIEPQMRAWDYFLSEHPSDTRRLEVLLARLTAMLANMFKPEGQPAHTIAMYLHEPFQAREKAIPELEAPDYSDLDAEAAPDPAPEPHPDEEPDGDRVLTADDIKRWVHRFNTGR